MRRSLAIDSDQEWLATQVPELASMGDVAGMAYTQQIVRDWRRTCTPEEAAEFVNRLLALQKAFQAADITMPFGCSLWILRTYQAELGLDVPAVAPPVAGLSHSASALLSLRNAGFRPRVAEAETSDV